MRHARSFGLVVVLVLLAATAGVPLAGADAAPPSLIVSVTADGGDLIELGRTAHLTITVTNSGESTVTAIRVEDTRCGVVGEIAELASGESADLAAEFEVWSAEQAAGTCTATGVGPAGEVVVASARHSLEVFVADAFADFAVTKRALTDAMVPGGIARYRVTITNVHGDTVDPDAPHVIVTDDFDDSKAVVLDAAGGKISGGTLAWELNAPGPDDPPVVLEYSLRVNGDAAGALVNTVEIDNPLDLEPANDKDSVTLLADVAAQPVATTSPESGSAGTGSGSTSSGSSSTEDPFLPFTGSDDTARTLWSIVFAALGMVLHMWSRRSEAV